MNQQQLLQFLVTYLHIILISKKFFRLNWKMIFLSCLFFTIKSIPSWAIPLVSANLIDLAEKAISLGGITDAIWNSIGWKVLFLIIVIVQNQFSYS